jgi:hypothetical protein
MKCGYVSRIARIFGNLRGLVLYVYPTALGTVGRFLSGGIIQAPPLSCTVLFLYTITLPAVSCDEPPTLSYTTLELASRVLLS